MLMMPVVVSVAPATVPAAAVAGQCWIVGSGAAGAWAGQDGAIACWTAGGWRFVAAIEGASVWSLADSMTARYLGGRWQVGLANVAQLQVNGVRVIGPQAAAIASPGGGTVVDVEARGALQSILMALRAHGLISATT